jgi:hypothetical protein
MYLLCSSKKGISSNQLSRTLGVTLKTAWFMGHRIREAMRVGGDGRLSTRMLTIVNDNHFCQGILSRVIGADGDFKDVERCAVLAAESRAGQYK